MGTNLKNSLPSQIGSTTRFVFSDPNISRQSGCSVLVARWSVAPITGAFHSTVSPAMVTATLVMIGIVGSFSLDYCERTR